METPVLKVLDFEHFGFQIRSGQAVLLAFLLLLFYMYMSMCMINVYKYTLIYAYIYLRHGLTI